MATDDRGDHIAERSVATKLPPDFKRRHEIGMGIFRAKYGPDTDPKDAIRSLDEITWAEFFLACPLAAWAMVQILKFFRKLEQGYIPDGFDEECCAKVPGWELEEDENALKNPFEYFRKGQTQDSERLRLWQALAFTPDIASDVWAHHYDWVTYTLAADDCSKLQEDLRMGMEIVGQPSGRVLNGVIQEIDRRFDDIETYVTAFKDLIEVRRSKLPESEPILFISETDHGPSVSVGTADEGDSPGGPTPSEGRPEGAGGATTAVELPQTILQIDKQRPLLRERRKSQGVQRQYASLEYGDAPPPTEPANTLPHANILLAAVAGQPSSRLRHLSNSSRILVHLRKRVWVWIGVLTLCTTSGILMSKACSKLEAASPSGAASQGIDDSGFYASLSSLVLYAATLTVTLAPLWRPRGKARLAQRHGAGAVGFMALTVIGGLACSVSYPYSAVVSLWAGYVCQLLQLLSMAILIEE